MNRIKELREKADNCRRAAAQPTTGGHSADLLLLFLANQYDYEANALERKIDGNA